VLEEACRQAAKWRAEGHADFVISVNLSPRQLKPGARGRGRAGAARQRPAAVGVVPGDHRAHGGPRAAHRILRAWHPACAAGVDGLRRSLAWKYQRRPST
jgi:hypothetical protein